MRLLVVPTHLVLSCKLFDVSVSFNASFWLIYYISSNFDQMSSPIGVPATMSRLRAKGVTRTHSGSYIPILSKQPTPAPSSSDRDDDYGQAGDLGVENPDMAIDDNAEALPAVRPL